MAARTEDAVKLDAVSAVGFDEPLLTAHTASIIAEDTTRRQRASSAQDHPGWESNGSSTRTLGGVSKDEIGPFMAVSRLNLRRPQCIQSAALQPPYPLKCASHPDRSPKPSVARSAHSRSTSIGLASAHLCRFDVVCACMRARVPS
eukprot:6045256-Pleurochrysis_carterae.AAC.1